MNLEQIKNDYAVSKGYKEWLDLILCISTSNNIKSNYSKLTLIENHLDNICELAQKECLKRASERTAEQYVRPITLNYQEIKDLITNENNIIK